MKFKHSTKTVGTSSMYFWNNFQLWTDENEKWRWVLGFFLGGGGVELDSCLLFIKNSFKRSIPMTKRQYLVGTCIDYSEFFGKLATVYAHFFSVISGNKKQIQTCI